jgi:hypothetical protein
LRPVIYLFAGFIILPPFAMYVNQLRQEFHKYSHIGGLRG